MDENTAAVLTDEFMRRMRLPEELRSTEEERANFKAYIAGGDVFLSGVACGQPIDYISDGLARELLYNWVFYARADCTEKFESAYLSQLINLRQRAAAGVLPKAGGAAE